MEKTPLESWIVNKINIDRNRRALEAYQLNKIKETIEYAKENSYFYKEKLKEISVEKITSMKDLQSIPFTLPEDIKENPFRFLSVSQKEVKRIVTLNTSGTSGREKRIFFSKEDIDSTIDFFQQGMRCLTNKNDRVLVLLPGRAFGSIGDLLKKALRMSVRTCIVQGVLTDAEETVRIIEKENINCIVGIPLQILYLSRVKNEVFKKRIDKVLLSTDYIPKVLINELTHEYGCSVFSHYGMTEMGYGGGVQCQALEGYHLREGDLYFEIINPDTNEVVSDGEYGEVVFTTLTRVAMPLIRYKTGDRAAFALADCPCGTFLKSMKTVEGRIDNRISLGKNQFLYLRELDEILLTYKNIIDYKAYINLDDKLILEIITQNIEGFNQVKIEIENNIQKFLFYKLGYKMDIDLIPKYEDKSSEITNSMVKRKILDYRGEG